MRGGGEKDEKKERKRVTPASFKDTIIINI